MNCIVLAFETLSDLPDNWDSYTEIDVFGPRIDLQVPKTVTLHNAFFDQRQVQGQVYDTAFIRHPDPWGEPRNWMQAIAALGQTLEGELVCEFWFPSEIKAFDALLRLLLDDVTFCSAKEIEAVGEWKNFHAAWKISRQQENRYEQTKTIVLQQFYAQEASFCKVLPLDDVRNLLKK